MIALSLKEIKSNFYEKYEYSIEEIIESYYNYSDCNDFSNLECPLCHKHCLVFHKTYERNLIYYLHHILISTKITITVCICSHCAKVHNKQKYHALLPEFILPYSIYEASTIINAINDYIKKEKLKEIQERLRIRHKQFYDWIKKISIYSLSSSIVLETNDNITAVISGIMKTSKTFLMSFYNTFGHPFFLFKRTCVPICVTP